MGKVAKSIVRNGMLWMNGEGTAVSTPIALESSSWIHWLNHHDKFKFEGESGHFTARREKRHGGDYWYAYRRRSGKLRKVYLGKSCEISLVRLEEAAMTLAGDTVLAQLSLTTDSPGNFANEPWLIHTSFQLRPKLGRPRCPIIWLRAPV